MSRDIRFDHKIVEGIHVIRSPDVKGLCVTARTLEEAEREARDMLALMQLKGYAPQGAVTETREIA